MLPGYFESNRPNKQIVQDEESLSKLIGILETKNQNEISEMIDINQERQQQFINNQQRICEL